MLIEAVQDKVTFLNIHLFAYKDKLKLRRLNVVMKDNLS